MSDESKKPAREVVAPLTPEEFRTLVEAEAAKPEAERVKGGPVERLIATVLTMQGMVGQLAVDERKASGELTALRLAVMCLCKARGGRIFVPLKHMDALGPRARLKLDVDKEKQECWIELEAGGVVIAGSFQPPKGI